jgi:hypothetical protein
VLGQLLGVGQQLCGQFLVAGRGRAALAGAGDGANGHLAILHPHQDFRARSGDGEVAEIEEIHVGAGIGPAQGAVERRGGQGELGFEALAQHHLEDIPGGDVVLGLGYHAEIFVFRRVAGYGDGFEIGQGRRGRQGATQPADGVIYTGLGSLIGLPGGNAWAYIDRSGQVELILERVEDGQQRRPHQRRLGQLQMIWIAVGQHFHVADHLIAQETVDARRLRRQTGRHVDLAVGHQVAQGIERQIGQGLETGLVNLRRAVDRCLAGLDLEDHVGLAADDRIAAARGAVLDGFEQEGVLPALRQLEVGPDRRLEIRHDATPDDLRLSSIVLLGEALIEVVAHRCRVQFGEVRPVDYRPVLRASTCCRACWLMVMRASSRTAVTKSP